MIPRYKTRGWTGSACGHPSVFDWYQEWGHKL